MPVAHVRSTPSNFGAGTARWQIYNRNAPEAQFPVEFESELLNRHGEARHVRWHAISLQEYCGHIGATILIGDDITEARRAEDQLRLTASVFESTNQAMVITDTAVKIISVNHAFSALTGYSRAEALGANSTKSRKSRTMWVRGPIRS